MLKLRAGGEKPAREGKGNSSEKAHKLRGSEVELVHELLVERRESCAAENKAAE